MYRDNTLIPSEAIRLLALGILATGEMPYAELASEVRYFAGHVVGPSLDLVGSRIALGVTDLDEAGAVIVDVGGFPVLFVSANGGGRAYEATEGLEVVDGEPVFDGEPVTISEDLALLADGTELLRRVTGQSFWFAWFGNFPDTDWWPKG